MLCNFWNLILNIRERYESGIFGWVRGSHVFWQPHRLLFGFIFTLSETANLLDPWRSSPIVRNRYFSSYDVLDWMRLVVVVRLGSLEPIPGALEPCIHNRHSVCDAWSSDDSAFDTATKVRRST